MTNARLSARLARFSLWGAFALALALTLGRGGSLSAEESKFATYNRDPLPKIKILSPREGEVLPEGQEVVVRYELTGLIPKEGGYHVHIILDDEPYRASYNLSSFNLGVLPKGSHTLRIFPSRPWHESFKNQGAYDEVNFIVGEPDGKYWIDHSKPTLTFSRPKRGATYGADLADRLLIDFYVHGLTLGKDGYHVRITFDDQSYLLTVWAPLYLENIPDGEHHVKIELLDKDGNLVNANFNPSEGTFSVDRGKRK